jgi:hypothetical protein
VGNSDLWISRAQVAAPVFGRRVLSLEENPSSRSRQNSHEQNFRIHLPIGCRRAQSVFFIPVVQALSNYHSAEDGVPACDLTFQVKSSQPAGRQGFSKQKPAGAVL